MAKVTSHWGKGVAPSDEQASCPAYMYGQRRKGRREKSLLCRDAVFEYSPQTTQNIELGDGVTGFVCGCRCKDVWRASCCRIL